MWARIGRLVRPLLFFLLCAALLAFLCLPQYTGLFNAALLDKYGRLASLKGPKVVLLGDSTLAFGVDSAALEAATGLPVVNMGLHQGLGFPFYADITKPHIGEGDLVIVCFASYSAYNAGLGDPLLAWVTLENHPALWRHVRPAYYPALLRTLPTYARRALNLLLDGQGNRTPTDTYYARAALNAYGDVALPRPANIINEAENPTGFIPGPMDPALRAELNAYHDYVQSKGATLYFACAPIYAPDVSGEVLRTFDALEAQLRADLRCTMLLHYADSLYDAALFYDTKLHLNDTGVARRTGAFIAALQAASAR